jgi:hypothetical protein
MIYNEEFENRGLIRCYTGDIRVLGSGNINMYMRNCMVVVEYLERQDYKIVPKKLWVPHGVFRVDCYIMMDEMGVV